MIISQMTDQHKEEALSKAFVQAIAARAGANESCRIFDYGIDGSFHQVANIGGKRIECGATIHFQLKASKNCIRDETEIIYDLNAEAYNRLVEIRKYSTVPCILIILFLPTNPNEWFEICEEYLQLRNCCYWMYWRFTTISSNSQSVRIRIPRSQHFTPETINMLFQQFSRTKFL